MLIDWQGLGVRMNTRAETLIGHGIEIKNGHLSAKERTRTLPSAPGLSGNGRPKREFPRPCRSGGSPPPGSPSAPCRCGVRDGSDSRHVFARAILVITDLDQTKRPAKLRIRSAFGLTPSEARLASLVGAGIAPRESADRLGISEENARTTLKRVFAKVGVSRESELAVVLARLSLR